MAELPNSATIIRTAWVYSSFGNNFVKTMLRLMNERECIEVVGDQIGSPTWAFGLAGTIWHLAASVDATGIFHWTDAGVASWYDFAVAIRDQARKVGWVRVGQCRVEPTTNPPRGHTMASWTRHRHGRFSAKDPRIGADSFTA
jgi:dTDP-4-dehydrorhamnose reductase